MTDRIDAPAPSYYPAVEFLDIPPMNDALTNPPPAFPGVESVAGLTDQIRSSLTSFALDYIEDLVGNHRHHDDRLALAHAAVDGDVGSGSG